MFCRIQYKNKKDSVIHKFPADDLLLNILYNVGNNVPFAQLA